MERARTVGAWFLAFAGVSLAFGVPAMAQSVTPSPTAPRGATVTGEVTGGLASGSTLTISVDATMPGGWEALHLVEATVLSGSQELERLAFNIEDNRLTVGEQSIAVGTGAVATGEYLRVSGSKVVVTTGAGNLSFAVDASVIRTIPEGSRFELSVTDDLDATVSMTKQLAQPEDGGLTWATVATVVVVALLAGGFFGNLFASHRRPPAKMSVYGTIARRIDADRKPAARGR